jgi:hypothetical protein
MGRMGLYSKATKAGPPGSPVSCIVLDIWGDLRSDGQFERAVKKIIADI